MPTGCHFWLTCSHLKVFQTLGGFGEGPALPSGLQAGGAEAQPRQGGHSRISPCFPSPSQEPTPSPAAPAAAPGTGICDPDRNIPLWDPQTEIPLCRSMHILTSAYKLKTRPLRLEPTRQPQAGLPWSHTMFNRARGTGDSPNHARCPGGKGL